MIVIAVNFFCVRIFESRRMRQHLRNHQQIDWLGQFSVLDCMYRRISFCYHKNERLSNVSSIQIIWFSSLSNTMYVWMAIGFVWAMKSGYQFEEWFHGFNWMSYVQSADLQNNPNEATIYNFCQARSDNAVMSYKKVLCADSYEWFAQIFNTKWLIWAIDL